jgi:hypothetical protein
VSPTTRSVILSAVMRPALPLAAIPLAALLMFAVASAEAASTPGPSLGDLSWPEAAVRAFRGTQVADLGGALGRPRERCVPRPGNAGARRTRRRDRDLEPPQAAAGPRAQVPRRDRLRPPSQGLTGPRATALLSRSARPGLLRHRGRRRPEAGHGREGEPGARDRDGPAAEGAARFPGRSRMLA